MGWDQISNMNDVVIYERRNRGYRTRIEGRLEEDRWVIYNTQFNDRDINLTEEFEAKTREEMLKIIGILKKQPPQNTEQLRKRMLQQRKKSAVGIRRAYKEYNVEKWHFGIGKDRMINFVVLRFYDSIDVDFVIHEKYRHMEERILESVTEALGLQAVEEELVINCYYFNRHSESKRDNGKKGLVLGQLEFEWENK